MTKKISWVIFAALAMMIGVYPSIYFIIDRKFGLLNSKSEELLADTFWNTGFYGHIVFGGIALLIGWMQFSKKLRQRNLPLHRNIGKAYVIAVLISGICGVYIGFFATGGIISSAGFIGLGVVWLFTTISSYLAIKKRDIRNHERMMIYSYAACFAAITLRIWLPILTSITGEFVNAYRLVAWLCWVPNMVAAYFIVRKLK